MQIKPLHIVSFVALPIIVIFNIYLLTIINNKTNENKNGIEKSIRNLTVQIDSINGVTQSRLDSVQIITNKKTEIKNYYTQKFYEIDSLNNDTSLVHYIKLQLQNLRSVQQFN